MRGAYSEVYLDDAMRNMGEMTEYAAEVKHLSLDLLFHMFVVSGFARRWENGDPRVLCGLSGTELCSRVLLECGMGEEKEKEALTRYDTDLNYWCGWLVAFYQWKKRIPFAHLFSSIGEQDLIRLFPALHTASEEKGVEVLDRLLLERNQVTRLQTFRKRVHFSQQELAERSGVNLRTLQQYEVRRKDINRAAANKLVALADILLCSPADLLEPGNSFFNAGYS